MEEDSWEGAGKQKWNWAGAKRRARHKIGGSGGVSSAACAPAGVERQRRRRRMLTYILAKTACTRMTSNEEECSGT